MIISFTSKHTEIIDLEDSSFNCPNVNDFPTKLSGATGGTIGETPFICSGFTGNHTKACHVLQQNGTWTQSVSINAERYLPASGSIIWNNQLVLAGGSADDAKHSIELASPSTGSTTLPIRVSSSMYASCIVKWDANTVMVITSDRNTYFINLTTNTVNETQNQV